MTPEPSRPSSHDPSPGSPGAPVRPHNRRHFEMHLEIQAPVDAVWRALSEAREIERWFAPEARVEPRLGGQLSWRWGELHTWDQTIEVWEPGQHLRTRYDSAVADGLGGKRPLFVDFHLEGRGGVTTLRLVQSGFGPEADFDAEYDGISQGWPVELRSLKLYLERHRGRERQLAWSTRRSDETPDVVWQRLVGPRGLAAKLDGLEEGDPFSLAVPGAGPIEGKTLWRPSAREFSGLAENLGLGWLRLHCEHWGGATQVWLWLALYDQAPERVEAYRQAFERLLERLVPAEARA